MNISNHTLILKKLKKFFRLISDKTPHTVYTICSLMAFAAINYTIIHSPFVLLVVAVLFVHELAHYFYAKSYSADVRPPIFIPLPFIAIAFVRVKNLLDEHKADVAISGMIFGALTILLFGLFNYYFNFISNIILAFMLAAELIFNIIGFDGAKYRRYRKEYSYA
jgi:hypothetical protein